MTEELYYGIVITAGMIRIGGHIVLTIYYQVLWVRGIRKLYKS